MTNKGNIGGSKDPIESPKPDLMEKSGGITLKTLALYYKGSFWSIVKFVPVESVLKATQNYYRDYTKHLPASEWWLHGVCQYPILSRWWLLLLLCLPCYVRKCLLSWINFEAYKDHGCFHGFINLLMEAWFGPHTNNFFIPKQSLILSMSKILSFVSFVMWVSRWVFQTLALFWWWAYSVTDIILVYHAISHEICISTLVHITY